jgi:hypothetical protein
MGIETRRSSIGFQAWLVRARNGTIPGPSMTSSQRATQERKESAVFRVALVN